MAILVFEHSDRSGVMRLGRTLRNYGHRIRIVSLHRGDPFPVDLDDVDGVITCGGPQSANDDSLEWLVPQMELLRIAHEAQMPIVGLCLGSQILARALGGEVVMMDKPEIGWSDVTLTPIGREDPVFAGIAWNTIQAQWHNECVHTLPPGARLLASSGCCKTQAWAHGLRTYAFQYHPEIEFETMEAFAADEPDALSRAGFAGGLEELRRQTERHYPAFQRLADRLFESIALFLMPVDRRYRGLVKDLHH